MHTPLIACILLLAPALAVLPASALELRGGRAVGDSAGGSAGEIGAGALGADLSDLRGTQHPVGGVVEPPHPSPGPDLGLGAPFASGEPTAAFAMDPTALIGLPIVTSDGVTAGRVSAVEIGLQGEPEALIGEIGALPGFEGAEARFSIRIATMVGAEIHVSVNEPRLRQVLAAEAASPAAARPDVAALGGPIDETGPDPISERPFELPVSAGNSTPLERIETGFAALALFSPILPVALSADVPSLSESSVMRDVGAARDVGPHLFDARASAGLPQQASFEPDAGDGNPPLPRNAAEPPLRSDPFQSWTSWHWLGFALLAGAAALAFGHGRVFLSNLLAVLLKPARIALAID